MATTPRTSPRSRRRRPRPGRQDHQPRLPLADDGAPPPGTRSDDGGWRLDERTRAAGRRGVAEARARLEAGARRAGRAA